jgi:N-acetylmuramic acid 6-phosphate etherase
VATELRHPHTGGLHSLDVPALVGVFNDSLAEVQRAMQAGAPALAAFIGAVESGFCARGGRLVYVGAGTSGRLGVLDASEVPPTFGVEGDRVIGVIAGGDSALRRSSEGMEDDPQGAAESLAGLGLSDADAVLAIAAGGTTPYALGSLVLAKRLAPGCVTGLLTCAPVGKVQGCDHVICLPTGPEVLTGSTRLKAGTATKLALNTISTALMVRSGRVYGNLMVDVRATNDKLLDRAARVVSQVTGAPRAEALELVRAAGGRATGAIVMRARAMGRAAAEGALEAAGGRLDRVLDGAPGA